MAAMERVLSIPVARLIEWVSRAATEEALREIRSDIAQERRFILDDLDDPRLPIESLAAARLRGEATMCDVLDRTLARVSAPEIMKRVILRAESALARAQ